MICIVKYWASLNCGMNLLMRPILYDAYHEIKLVNNVNRKSTEKYNIAGPCCESGDYLGKDRELGKLKEGDLLAVLGYGAYSFAMSNHYNTIPKPNVVMIYNNEVCIIRERETVDDLLSKEKIPECLK